MNNLEVIQVPVISFQVFHSKINLMQYDFMQLVKPIT